MYRKQFLVVNLSVFHKTTKLHTRNTKNKRKCKQKQANHFGGANIIFGYYGL